MHRLTCLSLSLVSLLLSACVYPPQPQQQTTALIVNPPQTLQEEEAFPRVFFRQTGRASYYGRKFHGKKTASGEAFNQHAFTGAHKTLPFGTKVKVTNLRNNKTVVVRINDRGPFSPGRVIDVSRAAATEIEMVQAGIVRVQIEALCAPDVCPDTVSLQ